MKYYIYISDAKVDMLFPQVPHDIKKKVATEWKMDLKLLSASRRVETEGEDNRIARLETVVDFIREYGNIGTVDEPDEYIEDTLQMRWGPFMENLEETPVVYFGGETEKTFVGLGGSMHNVIGNAGPSNANSRSATPALLDFLYRELNINKPIDLFSDEPDFYREYLKEVATPSECVALAATSLHGPEQNVEFLAKRLAYGPVDRSEDPDRKPFALLATPLYVAMAD